MSKLPIATAISLFTFAVTCTAAMAGFQPGIHYSGQYTWDEDTGSLTFKTSGTMPDSTEGFFLEVPAEVRKIVICANVTFTGGFRVLYREPSNPLHIVGEDRATSIIYGTDELRWTTRNKISENDKWKYGAVSVLADATVHVSNLTAQNPRGYNISGYTRQAVIHVSKCDLLDTRDGDNNNSDGFIGAAGSSIRDSLISTSDDGIKVYKDITIENVTIEHHRNGAPIQFGWGGETGVVKATINNLTIIGVDPENLHNMAPFTWEAGSAGTRNVEISGLTVKNDGKLYMEGTSSWQPMGLFELKPENCVVNFQAVKVDSNTPDFGIRNTKGTISIEGAKLP
jgi:hypothetical protein